MSIPQGQQVSPASICRSRLFVYATYFLYLWMYNLPEVNAVKLPVVQYKSFRFSKLNTPEFSHLNLLFGWIGYFILYFLTETLIPAERCTPVACFLDDIIPFCEWFLIPYVLWYGLVAGSLVHFARYHIEAFRKLSTYLIITQVVAMAVYILLPNRQDLRPAVFPRDNLLTKGVAILYSIDTNTNVCPSLHVAYSLGICSVWNKEDIPRFWKSCILLFVVSVCLSTAFIKQHSVLDALAAMPLCLFAEWFVFYRKKRRRQ